MCGVYNCREYAFDNSSTFSVVVGLRMSAGRNNGEPVMLIMLVPAAARLRFLALKSCLAACVREPGPIDGEQLCIPETPLVW